MRKLLVVSVLALLGLGATGCSKLGPAVYTAHTKVFGCPPVEPYPWKPVPKERVLNAVGDDCGKPIYRAPDCSRIAHACEDGSCEAPKK